MAGFVVVEDVVGILVAERIRPVVCHIVAVHNLGYTDCMIAAAHIGDMLRHTAVGDYSIGHTAAIDHIPQTADIVGRVEMIVRPVGK